MEYIWDIKSLTHGNVNGMENVIRQVVFSIGANNNGKLIEVHNSVGLDTPNTGDPFIAYSDVTEEHVKQWVTDALGELNMKRITDLVDAQFDIKHEDVAVSHTVPWKNVPSLT